jgi:glycosyltransferase involved in cell wall biosynthesis
VFDEQLKQSKPPLFSVITPNYNSRDALLSTSQSILSQDSDFEFIIKDGGSTDQSLEIARQCQQSCPERILLESSRDQGIYDAMNQGIRLARGRYLIFLGAGDTLLPNILTTVEKLLPNNDQTLIYGNSLYKGMTWDGHFDRRKLCSRNICHQAIFYGRKVFNVCGEYNLNYKNYADWVLNMKCFGNRQITKTYIPLTVCIFAEGGVSWNGDANFERERLRLIKLHLGWDIYARVKSREQLKYIRNKMKSFLQHAKQLHTK